MTDWRHAMRTRMAQLPPGYQARPNMEHDAELREMQLLVVRIVAQRNEAMRLYDQWRGMAIVEGIAVAVTLLTTIWRAM